MKKILLIILLTIAAFSAALHYKYTIKYSTISSTDIVCTEYFYTVFEVSEDQGNAMEDRARETCSILNDISSDNLVVQELSVKEINKGK